MTQANNKMIYYKSQIEKKGTETKQINATETTEIYSFNMHRWNNRNLQGTAILVKFKKNI